MVLRFAQTALVVMIAGLALAVCGAAGDGLPPVKVEHFDRDPGWEGINNRVAPQRFPTVVQDFGYSSTNVAGIAAGELGGRVTRAAEPAFYADRIGPLSLDDPLHAAGTFALTKTAAGSGVFFGFFRAQQPGAGGRPISSLGLDFDAERSGARLAVRLITAKNQSCGTFITPFLPGKFRPTPLRNDGTRYAWTLDYDPYAADDHGRFIFTLRSAAHRPGELETAEMPEEHRRETRRRFPDQTTFSVDLPEGFKQQATVFDHFGLMNMMKDGGALVIYFDDLQYAGRRQEFSADPSWDGYGNRRTYQATSAPGAHDFGFSNTSHAGGQPGEIGGIFWRGGKFGCYAAHVGPLSLDDRLEASGSVVLQVGAPDSDMYFGWFNGQTGAPAPADGGPFVGIHVGGPTRVGHYLRPAYAVSPQVRGTVPSGPVLQPDKVCRWSLVYDPAAEAGRGAIEAALGDQTVRLPLQEGVRKSAHDARLDRFGLWTSTAGGQVVRVYFDDIRYTVRGREPAAASGGPRALP